MQPTGRMGTGLRAGGTLPERAVERRIVRARAGEPAADAHFVRPHMAALLIALNKEPLVTAGTEGFDVVNGGRFVSPEASLPFRTRAATRATEPLWVW
jgi:hypothetical protein